MTRRDIVAANRDFYDALWSRAHLERPSRFNTWPLISPLLAEAPERLEIGPGMRPRLPVPGTHFLDISAPAIQHLNAGGGIAVQGEITDLPYPDQAFGLVCAFDVIEHVHDDRLAFGELSRVLRDDAVLIFSVPLFAKHWTGFDDVVGHARRYEPADLLARIKESGLTLEKSAPFGMAPKNERLLKFGMDSLEKHRKVAMALYNWLFMPLGILFQKRLKFGPGLIEMEGVDEVVLACRRRRRVPEPQDSGTG